MKSSKWEDEVVSLTIRHSEDMAILLRDEMAFIDHWLSFWLAEKGLDCGWKWRKRD